MTDQVISFFHCAEVSREDQISVMPSAVVEEAVITVQASVHTAYIYMEKAARRLKRWIKVTAEWFRRSESSRVSAFVRSVHRMTGVQILRRCAILRI